eukprot:TRINITY_DN2582_c0_g1_i1.p1 TRINITY_DN2582_c0_g1~~TRINITY_DN2582_c0_g1_i1.p1  ORF type:complete len:219 (+),score=44.42 TRINITY_DN2582_c0_g1_i1:101-757(+)
MASLLPSPPPANTTTPKPSLLPSVTSPPDTMQTHDPRSISPASHSGAENNGATSPSAQAVPATLAGSHAALWNNSMRTGTQILLQGYPAPVSSAATALVMKGGCDLDAVSALTSLSQPQTIITQTQLGKGGAARKDSASSLSDVAGSNTNYTMKRKRNNEAVRRCRMKKKQENEQRARRLAELEQRVKELEERNDKLSDLVAQQHAEIARYRQTVPSS